MESTCEVCGTYDPTDHQRSFSCRVCSHWNERGHTATVYQFPRPVEADDDLDDGEGVEVAY